MNFVIDAMLLLIVLALLFTTAVLRFVFPVPSASAGWSLWGHGYDAWSNFQFILMSIVALAVLLHLMLHWSWVCGVFVTKLMRGRVAKGKVDDGSQTLWGVGMLIVVLTVLGLLVAAADLMIRAPTY
jgi:hypothetical protein